MQLLLFLLQSVIFFFIVITDFYSTFSFFDKGSLRSDSQRDIFDLKEKYISTETLHLHAFRRLLGSGNIIIVRKERFLNFYCYSSDCFSCYNLGRFQVKRYQKTQAFILRKKFVFIATLSCKIACNHASLSKRMNILNMGEVSLYYCIPKT